VEVDAENAMDGPSEGATGGAPRSLCSDSTSLSNLPRNRDGTRRAVSDALLADTKFVHSMHGLIDTMMDRG